MTMAAEEAVVFFAVFAYYVAQFMRREESALLFENARWSK
jgi:hypothetical protein